jgi:hypothetical protein
MSQPLLPQHDLLELIHGACNATLTPSDFERLTSAMRVDAGARQLYLLYMSLDADLKLRQFNTDTLHSQRISLLENISRDVAGDYRGHCSVGRRPCL